MYITTQFAPITDEHEAYLFKLTPCAGYLWRWLIRKAKAGTELEIDLEEFREWTATVRAGRYQNQPYTWKQLRAAIAELIEHCLIEQVRRFSKRWRKWRAFNPDGTTAQKKNWSASGETSSHQNETERFQKLVCNPDSTVDLYKEFKRSADTTAAVDFESDFPEDRNEPEEVLSDLVEVANHSNSEEFEQTHSIEDQSSADFLQAVENLGIEVNPVVRSWAAKASADVRNGALWLVGQKIRSGEARTPVRFLVWALKHPDNWMLQWDKNRADYQFSSWFERVTKSGRLQRFSSPRKDITGHSEGVLCVMHPQTGSWTPWQEVKRFLDES